VLQDRKKRPSSGSDATRQLLDAFGDCYALLVDASGLIQEVNQPLAQFMGQTRSALLGAPVAKVFSSYGITPRPQRFRLAFDEPRQWRHNWSGRWFEVRTYPTAADDDDWLLAIMIRDISPQVAIEYGLQETRERLDTLTANLPGTVFSLIENDHDFSLIYLSQLRYRSFGFTQDDLLENPRLFSEHILSEDWRRLRIEAQLARIQGKALEAEFRLRTPSGRLLWLEVVASARGQIWDGLLFDITRRKWTEEALTESEQRLNLAMEAANEGIWDLNLQNGTLLCTPRCYAILGYAPHDIEPSSRAWLDLIHPEERRSVLVNFNRHLKGLTAQVDCEFRICTKAGGWLWVMSRGRVMDRTEDGRPARLLGTIIDVNERRLILEKNRRYEERLFQRQKLEAIGTLAGGIAHDFNNILSAIVGFTELLQDEMPANPLIRQHLNEIIKASDRGKGLIGQILNARNHGAGEKRPVQVELIVIETLKLLATSLPENVDLERDLDRTVAPVLADATHIHQVIMNLLTNALHAMSADGGTLSVSIKPAAAGELDDWPTGAGLCLAVGDSGSGIAPELQERIFEPFFSTREGGTGLGLATVKGLVTDLGGRIELESAPDKGSTFRVYLPCIAACAVKPARRSTSLPKGQGEHVLLVDDEAPVVEVGRQLLERLGYRVTALTDSPCALATFRSMHQDIDVVITDQAMPGLSGLDLAEAMHSLRPDVPIVLCTGLHDNLPQSPHFCRHILKPVAREELAQTLRQALKTGSRSKGRSDQV